jgi:cyclopropane-fatty-acyl-phospholipid synthase
MQTAIWLAEKGYVPEWILRKGIKHLLAQRIQELNEKYGKDPEAALAEWIDHMRKSPVALVPEKANEQHYEVPPPFYILTLGPHLKYSSAFYPESGPLV